MDRRTFTKSCIACMIGATVAPILSSCQSTHYATGSIEPDGLSISKSEFTYMKNLQKATREYIIIRNDQLEFPIYVYRISDREYSALWMKCTHQGNELQASGDHLHCSGHGSEFNNKGIVVQGPAEDNLRSFKVSADKKRIFIDLRA